MGSETSAATGVGTFEEYVAARGRWVENVAFLLAGDAHLAQDLAQQTLLQCFRKWTTVSTAAQPDAYVRRMLVNQLRTQQRRKAWTEVVAAEPPEQRAQHAQARPTDAVEEQLRVRAYLMSLAPRARAVVVLRYFEDLEVAEVADVLGITPSAVRATASRALDRLARLMTQEEDT